jgi:hypothetical protein
VIASAKENSTLVFPEGDYWFYKSLVQINKGLKWDGNNTNLCFNHPDTALQLKRNGSTARTTITGINFLSRFNGDSTGQNGIWSSVPITLRDVVIENFHGDGLRLTAGINVSAASDVSFAKVEDVVIRSCAGNGIYIAGGDSNAGTFTHCDIRDCGGVGIWDASFLGNNFFGCMTHNNAGGSYKASDANSRSNFFGCYCEDGQPLVYLNGASCWFGGLPSSGIELRGVAQVFSYPTVKILK